MGSCTVCLRLKKCHLWLRTFLWWKVCIFLFSCISCTYLCRCAAFWPFCWAGQRTTSNLMVSKTWAFLSILHWMFPSPCDMPFWAFNLCYVSCCSNLMLEKSFLFFFEQKSEFHLLFNTSFGGWTTNATSPEKLKMCAIRILHRIDSNMFLELFVLWYWGAFCVQNGPFTFKSTNYHSVKTSALFLPQLFCISIIAEHSFCNLLVLM